MTLAKIIITDKIRKYPNLHSTVGLNLITPKVLKSSPQPEIQKETFSVQKIPSQRKKIHQKAIHRTHVLSSTIHKTSLTW